MARVLELRSAQPRRTFLVGILIAFVAMAEELAAATGTESNKDPLTVFGRQLVTGSGATVNTLNLLGPNGSIELRPYYNLAETVARHWLLRARYPNSAPHATGQWQQHSEEFELICSMTGPERLAVVESMWNELLDMEELVGASDEPRTIRPFEVVLRDFPTAPKEPGGAVLQGLAYAYYRADSPGLTLVTAKVGSGSSRRPNAVADVDGWDGNALVLSAEVKDLAINESNLTEFDQFILNLRRWPNATAVVLANSFTDEALAYLDENNLLAFDRSRMASVVSYWDLAKQKAATRAFQHFLDVIQGHDRLSSRFRNFSESEGLSF